MSEGQRDDRHVHYHERTEPKMWFPADGVPWHLFNKDTLTPEQAEIIREWFTRVWNLPPTEDDLCS